MRPFAPSAAAHLNFGAYANEDRVRTCCSEERYRRLAALRRWGPDTVCRYDANIERARAAAAVPEPRQVSTAPVAG